MDFLKNSLPQHCGVILGEEVPYSQKLGRFTLVDDKACHEAKGSAKYGSVCTGCDRAVLRIDSNGQEIAVIRYEEYINRLFDGKTEGPKRCDIILTDSGVEGDLHRKIVFCDLCCYDKRHIGKKRAAACKQMKESVEFLLEVPVLNQHILTYREMVCLFAYRLHSNVQQSAAAQRGNAEANMLVMTTTASSVSGQVITKEEIIGHGFEFVRNRYPSEYRW